MLFQHLKGQLQYALCELGTIGQICMYTLYAKEWWRPVGVKQRPLKRQCSMAMAVVWALYCMVEVKRKYCLHVKHGVTAGNIYSGLNPDASRLNNKCFPFFLNFVSVFLCL